MSKTADETSSASPATAPAIPPAPTRRKTLEYFNPSSAGDRFWRMISSREKVVENLKTLAWVIPITLVIWIYAEREQVIAPTGPNVNNVSVTITTSDPRLYVEMVDNSQPTVNLKLTGPQLSLEKVKERLISNIPRGLPTIDLGASMAVGNNQPVDIMDRIQNMELFRSNGVTVQEVQPPTIRVNIDRLEHRELTVQIPPGVTSLSSDTHFDPPKVTVSGPRSLLDPLVDTGLKAYANIAGSDQLTEGRHTLNGVPVVLSSPQEKLHIDPPVVKVDALVKAADVSYTIVNMPITVNQTPKMSDNFKIVITDGESIPSVTVTGPQEQIDAIKTNQFHPSAVLNMSLEDTGPTAPTSKKPTYILPPGVKVSPESDQPIKFELTPRNA